MFRFDLLLCVSLIFGITAKPYKTWQKAGDEVLMDTVMSLDATGKMSWGMEVEPPEDMDTTDIVIEPRMKILSKEMKAEEDLDELHHPDLLGVQIHPDDTQEDPLQDSGEYNLEPEADQDDIDHPVFSVVDSEEQLRRYLSPLMAEYNAGAGARVHLQPEEDMDDLYHKDTPQLIPYLDDVEADVPSQRKHSKPEEDLDYLYHM